DRGQVSGVACGVEKEERQGDGHHRSHALPGVVSVILVHCLEDLYPVLVILCSGGRGHQTTSRRSSATKTAFRPYPRSASRTTHAYMSTMRKLLCISTI